MQGYRVPIARRAAVVAMLISSLLAGWPCAVLAEAGDDEGEISAECRALRQDTLADVGDVLRAGCEPTLEQMSRLMDNPLGNVAMWINQFDYLDLSNDETNRGGEAQYNYMGIFQFPTGITEDWNIINRIVYMIPSTPIDQDKANAFMGFDPFQPPGGGPTQPPPAGSVLPIDVIGGRTSGFGDMVYLGLASPKEAIKTSSGASIIWGVGLGQTFPSASEKLLGDGKWSMGPSALAGYLGLKWTFAALLQTYFSYAGDSSRDDVRLLNLQYFYYYKITDTVSIGAGPNIIANFEAGSGNQWTVPLGIGINKTFQLGKLPVRIGVEYMGSMVRPDSVGATHNVRVYMIPAVPAALIPILP